VVRTRFEKIRVQKNFRRDPERIERFVHDLKSNVDLGNIRAVYNDLQELVPEMIGPSFEELTATMFS
jgi:hypothetical protein